MDNQNQNVLDGSSTPSTPPELPSNPLVDNPPVPEAVVPEMPSTSQSTPSNESPNPQQNPDLNPPVLSSESTSNETAAPYVPTPLLDEAVGAADTVISDDSNTPPKKTKKILIIVAAVFSLLVFSGLVSAAVLAAYGKIPVSDPQIRGFINKVVFALPFLPKTPEYVLQSSLLAHQEVSTAAIDASFAIDSPSFSGFLGSSTLDMAIKGPVDFTSPENPRLSLSVQVTNQFEMDLLSADKNIYFKLRKLPPMLTGFLLGMNENLTFDPLLNRWVKVETTKLETEARKALEENQTTEEPFDEAYVKLVNDVFMQDILPKIKMTSESLNGLDTHKLTLELTGPDIDLLVARLEEKQERHGVDLDIDKTSKPSDMIQSVKLNFWIEKGKYYLRKSTFYVLVDPKNTSPLFDAPNSMSSFGSGLEDKIDIVFDLSLDRIGETVSIDIPQSYMTQEEFTAEVTKLFTTLYSTPEPSALNTSDTSF